MLEHAQFLLSANQLYQLPEDRGKEIAFCGRSNAGKSTAINCLTRQHRLARTSKAPGRTQLINVFTINPHQRLIDLPGYGFARVSSEVKYHWRYLLTRYFATRRSLCGIVLMMDSRHPLQTSDHQMIELARLQPKNILILLTKADKLSKSQQAQVLRHVQQYFASDPSITVQCFSGKKPTGVIEARAYIEQLLACSSAAEHCPLTDSHQGPNDEPTSLSS